MLMKMVCSRWVSLLIIILIIFGLMLRLGEAQSSSSSSSSSKSYFVSCGSSSTSVIAGGRKWIGDLASDNDNNFTLSSPPGVVVNTTSLPANSTSPLAAVYKSARVFSDQLNYSFQGIRGNYIVRLHFCPFQFGDFDVNKSSFGVVADGFQLMSQFDVPGKIADMNSNLLSSDANSTTSFSLVKEYILAIDVDSFVITFVPTKGSFGFINAIELVPVLNALLPDSVSKVGGNEATLSGRGIEMMYRLNVGGGEIDPNQDSDLWRTWEVDSGYMITANAGVEISNSSNITYASTNDSSVAPLQVYETARTMSNTEVLEKRFNMSWKFKVDPNFDYLIRLHFCELVYDKANQRIFKIFINNRTAANSLDIYAKAGGMNIAYHQDYFDAVSSSVNTLWIQLGPDTAMGASGTDALLNGLEIFKLSKNGNLAYVEIFDSSGNSSASSKTRMLWVGIGAGAFSVVVVAVAVILVFCFCRNRRNQSGDTKNNPPGWRPLFLHVHSTPNAKGAAGSLANGSVASVRVGKQFTLAEIRAATNNFDESLVIGVGGFGKVYKGETEDGTLAAIKRANPQSQQGLTEFETEIEMLSKLRHRHLVSLIGFCEDESEMILVYEYMANGTLRSHLFGADHPPLTWKQRLEACIGAARGLHYLHTGAERGIIHRDVKTTNILLDENFVAKMSDFGLSKAGPALDHTHVSTAVKGSFGYLDPEYFRRQQLTEKSDVYSFGVVLFEVVCARPVINPTLPKDEINLAEWALRWQWEKSLETIVDPRLKGKYSPESLEKFGEIAEKCLGDEGKMRPTMGEVLWHLEYVLQLHDAWVSDQVDSCSNSSKHILGDVEEEKAGDEEEVSMNLEMSGGGEFSTTTSGR